MTADFPFPADTADAIADRLRAHGWTATTAWSCGCAPAGLCPTHQHMRDEEQS